MGSKEIRNILVVDNNKVILRLMSHLLEEMGFNVKTAVNGLDALEVLSDFHADIVFVDLVMPKISGEKLCRILRSMPEMQNSSLVIFSAIAAEEKVDFKKMGADACIAKGPFKEVKKHVVEVISQIALAEQSILSGEIIGKENIFEREITKELLSTKKHFEIALNRISEAFLELTADGKIVYANAAACKLVGVSEEKLLSSSFVHCFHKNFHDRIRRLLSSVTDEESLKAGEEKELFIHNRQVLLNMVSVAEQNQKCIVVIINDITERKKVELELKKNQEDLERKVAKRTLELIEANEKLKRDIVERKKLLDERENLIDELKEALARVKTLSGLLPICSSCKKIRDDKGFWQQVEAYIGKHSNAQFSHSICPSCAKKLYPEVHEK